MHLVPSSHCLERLGQRGGRMRRDGSVPTTHTTTSETSGFGVRNVCRTRNAIDGAIRRMGFHSIHTSNQERTMTPLVSTRYIKDEFCPYLPELVVETPPRPATNRRRSNVGEVPADGILGSMVITASGASAAGSWISIPAVRPSRPLSLLAPYGPAAETLALLLFLLADGWWYLRVRITRLDDGDDTCLFISPALFPVLPPVA